MSYTAACVHHSAENTFLSRTLYSLGMNYAALDGNHELASGMNDYNLHLSMKCASRYTDANRQYDGLVSQLLQLNDSLQVYIKIYFLQFMFDVIAHINAQYILSLNE